MEHKDQPPMQVEEHNFKFYSRSNNFAKIIGNRMMIFGTWGLIGYIGQFLLIIIGINLYSDHDRLISCYPNDSKWKIGNEINSAVYDKVLIMLCTYHLVEWVRLVMFLVTIVLGQNFMPLWYISALNTIFGLATYIYVHIVRFSGDGLACAGR